MWGASMTCSPLLYVQEELEQRNILFKESIPWWVMTTHTSSSNFCFLTVSRSGAISK